MYIKICLFLIIFFVVSIIPSYAKAPNYSPQTALNWVLKAEVDPVFAYVVKNESGGNPNAYNPKDTDGRPKYGLLQFGWEEFYSWSEKAGISDPDIWNPDHQAITYTWAAKNGLLRRWGTFVKLFP